MLHSKKKNYHSLVVKKKSPNTEKTLQSSDPQRAPPTAPLTLRWPRYYPQTLAISSYEQFSEGNKMSFHVYSLVKTK